MKYYYSPLILALAISLTMFGCATVQPPSSPVEKAPELTKCAKDAFCWDSVVEAKITPAMLAANVESFCPKYKSLDRKKVWLNIIKAMSYAESGWNPETRYVETTQGIDKITGKRNESVGLLQMSCGDVLSSVYGKFPSAIPFDCRTNPSGITDPVINLNFGLDVMNYWAAKGGSLDISSTKSVGAYWSSARIPYKDAKGKWHHEASRAKMKKLMPSCF